MQNQTYIKPGNLFAERYQIQALLGKGGMGEVYLALDSLLDNTKVALKVLSADLANDKTYSQRFLREIQLTRQITHQNVARTYEAGRSGSLTYFVMEYINGVELQDLMGRGSMSIPHVVSILEQICDGLAAIHEAGVVHRDLKPANIMLSPEGLLKITDFGIARSEASSLTAQFNEVLGSAPYMAPEIWSGDEVTPRSDLYALGVLAYEMVGGKLPFLGPSPHEFMYQHLQEAPAPLRTHVATVPQWFEDLIVSLLAKNPQYRIASTDEVKRRLKAQRPDQSSPSSASATQIVQGPDIDSEYVSAFDAPPAVLPLSRTVAYQKYVAPTFHSQSPAIPAESKFATMIGNFQSSLLSYENPDSPSSMARLWGWYQGISVKDVLWKLGDVVETGVCALCALWFFSGPLTNLYETLLAQAPRTIASPALFIAVVASIMCICALLTIPVAVVSRLFMGRIHGAFAWVLSAALLSIFTAGVYALQTYLLRDSVLAGHRDALTPFRNLVTALIEAPLLIPMNGFSSVSKMAAQMFPTLSEGWASRIVVLFNGLVYLSVGFVLNRLMIHWNGLRIKHWMLALTAFIPFLMFFECTVLGLLAVETQVLIDLPWIGTVQHSVVQYRVWIAAFNWALLSAYLYALLRLIPRQH
jgi:serine/threonine protein kinase